MLSEFIRDAYQSDSPQNSEDLKKFFVFITDAVFQDTDFVPFMAKICEIGYRPPEQLKVNITTFKESADSFIEKVASWLEEVEEYNPYILAAHFKFFLYYLDKAGTSA